MTAWWGSNTAITTSDSNSTWHAYDNSTWNTTYKITYYDPVEDQYRIDDPAPKPKKAPKKKTTIDPLDWLDQRVAEITELVEL